MQLERTDEIIHPFYSTRVTASTGARRSESPSDRTQPKEKKIVGHISKPAAPSQGEEVGYRPPWWRGDDQNYIVAKKMMVAMPQTLKTNQ